MSVFLQPIYTQTVGAGGAASVTFNNIPQGFTDLKIVMSLRSSGGTLYTNQFADGWGVDINGSSANINSFIFAYGSNGSAAAARYTNSYIYFGPINGSGSTANTFTSLELYIPNYTAGQFKPSILDSSAANTSTTLYYLNLLAHNYRNTNPITSLTIRGGEGNLVQGSTITVYGVSAIYDTASPAAPTIGTPVDLGGVISVPFTANDSGQGQTADYYSITSSPSTSTFYANGTPGFVTSPTLGQAYTLTASANNAVGSNASSASSSVTTNNNFAAITTTTLTGSAGTITFTNIPQYYRHLQIRIQGLTSANNANVVAALNLDGSAVYSRHEVYGDGSSTAAFAVGSDTVFTIAYISGGVSATSPFVAIVDILDYTDTSKFTTIKSLAGRDVNGGGWTQFQNANYRSFAPITAITFDQVTWLAGSVFSVYGIG